MHIRNARDFVGLEADVVIRAELVGDFFAQKRAHGFSADAAHDLTEDVADVTTVSYREGDSGCPRRSHVVQQRPVEVGHVGRDHAAVALVRATLDGEDALQRLGRAEARIVDVDPDPGVRARIDRAPQIYPELPGASRQPLLRASDEVDHAAHARVTLEQLAERGQRNDERVPQRRPAGHTRKHEQLPRDVTSEPVGQLMRDGRDVTDHGRREPPDRVGTRESGPPAGYID